MRIVGATHVDLRRAVAEKRFRADLFYRLHEIEIQLPPLRERTEDVLPLARHFLRAYGGDAAPTLDERRRDLLVAYALAGQRARARELHEARARAPAATGTPHPDRRRRSIRSLSGVAGRPRPAGAAACARSSPRPIAARSSRVLEEAQGNKSRAAERLGVSRKTLYARMRRLGLEVEELS